MAGTTVPVVSAKFTVSYKTCSTTDKLVLTPSFADPVATYGTESSVELIGTTSASPF